MCRLPCLGSLCWRRDTKEKVEVLKWTYLRIIFVPQHVFVEKHEWLRGVSFKRVTECPLIRNRGKLHLQCGRSDYFQCMSGMIILDKTFAFGAFLALVWTRSLLFALIFSENVERSTQRFRQNNLEHNFCNFRTDIRNCCLELKVQYSVQYCQTMLLRPFNVSVTCTEHLLLHDCPLSYA